MGNYQVGAATVGQVREAYRKIAVAIEARPAKQEAPTVGQAARGSPEEAKPIVLPSTGSPSLVAPQTVAGRAPINFPAAPLHPPGGVARKTAPRGSRGTAETGAETQTFRYRAN